MLRRGIAYAVWSPLFLVSVLFLLPLASRDLNFLQIEPTLQTTLIAAVMLFWSSTFLFYRHKKITLVAWLPVITISAIIGLPFLNVFSLDLFLPVPKNVFLLISAVILLVTAIYAIIATFRDNAASTEVNIDTYPQLVEPPKDMPVYLLPNYVAERLKLQEEEANLTQQYVRWFRKESLAMLCAATSGTIGFLIAGTMWSEIGVYVLLGIVFTMPVFFLCAYMTGIFDYYIPDESSLKDLKAKKTALKSQYDVAIKQWKSAQSPVPSAPSGNLTNTAGQPVHRQPSPVAPIRDYEAERMEREDREFERKEQRRQYLEERLLSLEQAIDELEDDIRDAEAEIENVMQQLDIAGKRAGDRYQVTGVYDDGPQKRLFDQEAKIREGMNRKLDLLDKRRAEKDNVEEELHQL